MRRAPLTCFVAATWCALSAAPALADDPDLDVALDDEVPYDVQLELELRYAAAETPRTTSDAWVSRLMARWAFDDVLELRVDWGIAIQNLTRSHAGHSATPFLENEERTDVILGNPSVAFGILLGDTPRPFAASGFTVELLVGVTLPLSNPELVPSDAPCLHCNLPAMAEGGQRYWTWNPMTLAGWTSLAVRRGFADSWFLGFDSAVAGFFAHLGDDDAATTGWSLEAGLEGGWNFARMLTVGARLQGMFASYDLTYDLSAVGGLVPFVELDLAPFYMRVETTLDLWSVERAPWSVGMRTGIAW